MCEFFRPGGRANIFGVDYMISKKCLVALGALILTSPLWAAEQSVPTTDLEKSEAAMFSELDRLTEKVFSENADALPPAQNQTAPSQPVPSSGIEMRDVNDPAPQGQVINVQTAPAKTVSTDTFEMATDDSPEASLSRVRSLNLEAPAETINDDLVDRPHFSREDVVMQFSTEQQDKEKELPPGARFWETAAPRVDSLGKDVDKGLVKYDEDDGYIHTNIYIRLRDCITMGLEKNLGLTVERYKPEYYREGIRAAKGAFDPHLVLGINWQGGDSPRPYVKVQTYQRKIGGKVYNIPYDTKLHIGNTRSQTTTYQMAITGKFATGLQYLFSAGLQRTWNNFGGTAWGNPRFGSSFNARLTMPLLRDFGIDVNLAPVRVARNNWRIAKESLDDYMQSFITQIVFDYWTLYYWREQTGAEEYTLALAKNLLYVTDSKRAVGLVASNEVIQAQARIASQEQSLLSSRNSIRDAEDNLRYIINFEMNDLYRPKALRPYQYHLVPLEKPQVTDITLNESDLIETALIKRKALEVAKLQLKNAKENLKVSKNHLFPKLDATVAMGATGIGNTHDRSITDLSSGRHLNYEFGFDFIIPFFFWDAVGGYRQAKYAKQQAELNIENVQQGIVVEVRTAIRAVQTDRKRITAAREATRLAYEQLYYEQEKYKAGLVTTYDVLLLQNDLAKAMSAEIKALVDWRVSLSELSRAIGMALDYNDVVIDDYYKLPKMEESYFTRFLWQ